jgi:hypothetical protein
MTTIYNFNSRHQATIKPFFALEVNIIRVTLCKTIDYNAIPAIAKKKGPLQGAL